jgi:hypothetical protein
MNNNYYVYIILDPLENYEFSIGDLKFNSKPFYIGYGKNNRVNEHLHKRELNRNCHKSCKIKSIINTGNIPIIIKIKENLSFEDANNLEIKYISLFGRIDKGTGILTNHTDGGQGTKNKILSEESKKKISKSHMGILHTEESKLKMSLKHKGKILSDITKKKISESMKEEGNPFYGKKHNDITRDKLSLIASQRVLSDETKAKKQKAMSFSDSLKQEYGIITGIISDIQREHSQKPEVARDRIVQLM